MAHDLNELTKIGRAIGIMRRAIKDADKGKSLVVLPPHLAKEIEDALEIRAGRAVIDGINGKK